MERAPDPNEGSRYRYECLVHNHNQGDVAGVILHTLMGITHRYMICNRCDDDIINYIQEKFSKNITVIRYDKE